MIQQEIFVCGESILSHPVTFLFHLDDSVHKGEPTKKVLADLKLVIADCRVALAKKIAEWVDVALSVHKPVLLLCPDADTLADLHKHVGVLPILPVAALLIKRTKNESGLMNFAVDALDYSETESKSGSDSGPSRSGAREKKPASAASQMECACTDYATLSRVFVDASAVDTFKMKVETAMEKKEGLAPRDGTPPTGLKYFLHVFSTNFSFTYSGAGASNKPGNATFTWTVWGFLNQTAQSNSQYLSVEGRINVYAGELHRNDSCDRGFGNAYVRGTLTAPMNALAFVPTSGSGDFSGTVDIPISYKSPLGGYQIWNYNSSMNNKIDSWSCKAISSAASLGAQWWMNRPCDGSNVPDKWKDAFSFWGHVHDFTGASSGSLDVNSISAWVTPTLLTGYQTISGDFSWEGAHFWGSSCSPGMYWGINAYWMWFYNANPGFRVDFTPINPS